MLGQRKPYDLPLTLANAMSDVVTETMSRDYLKIMHYHEAFDFVPGNRSLSAVEVSLVNVTSRETVLKQYEDNAKRDYDYVLLYYPASRWVCWLSTPCPPSGYVLISGQTG